MRTRRLAWLAALVALAALGTAVATRGLEARSGSSADAAEEGPTPSDATAEEVEAYFPWVEMVVRRASRAAMDHWERATAERSREELRKSKRWLEDGLVQELLRGPRPAHLRPVSCARRIDRPREDECARSVSCFRKSLRHLHEADRAARAVLEAAGLDPEREAAEEEQIDRYGARARRRTERGRTGWVVEQVTDGKQGTDADGGANHHE